MTGLGRLPAIRGAPACGAVLSRGAIDGRLPRRQNFDVSGLRADKLFDREAFGAQVIGGLPQEVIAPKPVRKGVEAMSSGAMEFLEKPADIDLLLEQIEKARANRVLLMEKRVQRTITDILRTKGW